MVLRWLGTKLVKENEPERNLFGFPTTDRPKQRIIHVVMNRSFRILSYILITIFLKGVLFILCVFQACSTMFYSKSKHIVFIIHFKNLINIQALHVRPKMSV